jgi:hypothetical protein
LPIGPAHHPHKGILPADPPLLQPQDRHHRTVVLQSTQVGKSLAAHQGIEHESVQHIAHRSGVWAGALDGIALGQILHDADPLQIVTPGRNPSVRRQSIPAIFYPDTSAASFPPKSTFAFTLWVKPSKFQNAFHCPILSASVDCQQIFNCGL